MAQAMETPQKMTKGGRVLLMVWRWELEKILQVNQYLPRQSRGATLEIMAQMDQHPGQRPGVAQETFCDCNHGDIESTWTWYQQTSPQTEDIPQRLPTTWPRCLARGAPIDSFLPHLANPIFHLA